MSTKNSLSLIGGCSHPFDGCAGQAVTGWVLLTRQQPLDRHRGHLLTCRPVCHLRLCPVNSGAGAVYLPWNSPLATDLLHLFRVSVDLDIRYDLPWMFIGDGTTNMWKFPDPQTHGESSLVTCHINVHSAQRDIWEAESTGVLAGRCICEK